VVITNSRNMKNFMMDHFQGVGVKTAANFLEAAGINPRAKPRTLKPEDIVKLVRTAKEYPNFKRPDPTCLSPIGEELLENGIRKELGLTEDDFLKVVTRKPSTYLGFPFIVEVAIATGSSIRRQFKGGTNIIRFANRIPLLFDESSGVIWKVVNRNIHWDTYKVTSDTPMIVVVHVCSTKIPYKTVGKEYMADQPEVEREITNAIRTAARSLRLYISRGVRLAREKHRLDIFAKFLPKIAEFAAKLSDREELPDIAPLLAAVSQTIPEVEKKLKEVRDIGGQSS